jgi:DnaJ-class molecular chaperone
MKNDALKKIRGPEADFYSVFSVGKEASLPELVRAYRKTSLEYHPDKVPFSSKAGR